MPKPQKQGPNWLERTTHGAIVKIAINSNFADRLRACIEKIPKNQISMGPNQIIAGWLCKGLSRFEERAREVAIAPGEPKKLGSHKRLRGEKRAAARIQFWQELLSLVKSSPEKAQEVIFNQIKFALLDADRAKQGLEPLTHKERDELLSAESSAA